MRCDNRLALTMNGVIRRGMDDLDGLQASEFETYQIFEKDDLAFKLIDLQNVKTSRVGLVPEKGIMSPAYLRICSTGAVNAKYAYWYFMKLYHECVFNDLGGGVRQTIGHEELLFIPLPHPSRVEQGLIATFLDRETAKIDALIAEQQRLIELLQEKRQAVISHAVTKGLNPDAPMKDSGVEWLGEVPEHWTAAKLKYHVRQIVDGAHFTPTYVDEGVPFLRVTDIRTFPIDHSTIKFIPEEEHKELAKRCRPERGDLLLSKNGTIGVPRVVDWDWDFSIFVSLCLLKVKSSLDVRFLYYYFLTHQISEQIFGLIKQSTVINLHLDKIESFWLAIPGVDEQERIVEFLDQIVGKYDLQIKHAEAMNKLLEERRSALISAAVTGQIDVRDLVSAEAAA